MAGKKTSIARRRVLKTLAATAVSAPFVNRGAYKLFAQSEREYSSRVIDLVGRSLVIDMLSPPEIVDITTRQDLAWNSAEWLFAADDVPVRDLEKIKRSGITVFHTGSGIYGEDPFLAGVKHFGAWNNFLANHAGNFMRIDSPGDLEAVKASGKIGLLLGVQQSRHFVNVTDVTYFHKIGQRVSQLTYNSQNMIGSGCTERGDGGLSVFGVQIVRQMNKVGMLIDVSHCGDRTTLDAIDASSKPLAITHANCRALVPGQPRNKTDEAIVKMAEKGGVMGITTLRSFVRDSEPTTIDHVVDHYDHVIRLTGIEHVGIGSDVFMTGYDDMPQWAVDRLRLLYDKRMGFREKFNIEGLHSPERIFNLVEALVRRGYSDANIEAILGGNFKRLLKTVWS